MCLECSEFVHVLLCIGFVHEVLLTLESKDNLYMKYVFWLCLMLIYEDKLYIFDIPKAYIMMVC